mgnify:CR=1 FL=1
MICVLRSFKVNSGFIQNASKFSSLIRAPADNKNRKSPLLFNGPCRRARRNFSASGTSSAESQRIVKMALAGNMAITVAKAACWMGTGSSAMLSETVHSLVDSGNQALLLVGLRRAESAADHRHPCTLITTYPQR